MNKCICLSVLLVCGVSIAGAKDVPIDHQHRTPQMSYLENDAIRLGVDLDIGGAITYLAPATNHDLNVINSHDWGRQVQLSYYSGPNPYQPAGATMSKDWHFLGWNPIQSGDCFAFKSQVLTFTNTGRSLYIKLVPMQWPLKNVPAESVCEVWLELAGPVVKARTRLTNHRADKTQYPARTQEMPAVYVNGPYCHLFTYTGEQPYSGGPLTQMTNRLDLEKHWTSWLATEHWAAQVNDAGWGLGIWTPEATRISGGFYEQPGSGGPEDPPTGYLAPNREEILDYNIVFDYRYELILGTLAEIRALAVREADTNMPHWEFTSARHGWYFNGANDAGWPIQGQLKIRPNITDRNNVVGRSKRESQLSPGMMQIVSPEFFLRGGQASNLVVEAAFESVGKDIPLLGREMKDGKSNWQGLCTISVVPDGRMRRYEVSVKNAFAKSNALTQLRFDVRAADTNAVVQLRSITFE